MVGIFSIIITILLFLSTHIILLKDLTNIATAMKKTKSRNDNHIAVKTLMEKYGVWHFMLIL